MGVMCEYKVALLALPASLFWTVYGKMASKKNGLLENWPPRKWPPFVGVYCILVQNQITHKNFRRQIFHPHRNQGGHFSGRPFLQEAIFPGFVLDTLQLTQITGTDIARVAVVQLTTCKSIGLQGNSLQSKLLSYLPMILKRCTHHASLESILLRNLSMGFTGEI